MVENGIKVFFKNFLFFETSWNTIFDVQLLLLQIDPISRGLKMAFKVNYHVIFKLQIDPIPRGFFNN